MSENTLRDKKKQATRQALAEAAFNLALESGVDGFVVEDIVTKAGYSRRTFANYFTCKEEAIAAPVNPGVRTLFLDKSHGVVYSKLIDPQTGASDFREYTEPVVTQPAAPQYMNVEMFNEYRDGLERRIEAMTKGVTADD